VGAAFQSGGIVLRFLPFLLAGPLIAIVGLLMHHRRGAGRILVALVSLTAFFVLWALVPVAIAAGVAIYVAFLVAGSMFVNHWIFKDGSAGRVPW
jgi:hypothetical protein